MQSFLKDRETGEGRDLVREECERRKDQAHKEQRKREKEKLWLVVFPVFRRQAVVPLGCRQHRVRELVWKPRCFPGLIFCRFPGLLVSANALIMVEEFDFLIYFAVLY